MVARGVDPDEPGELQFAAIARSAKAPPKIAKRTKITGLQFELGGWD